MERRVVHCVGVVPLVRGCIRDVVLRAYWGGFLLVLLAACSRSPSSSSDPTPAASIPGQSVVTETNTSLSSPRVGSSVTTESGVRNTPGENRITAVSPVDVVVKTNLGSFTIRLRPDKAPRTVENFLNNYVDRGFYDQTIFHHVEKDFMVVAGGYTVDLQAKPTRVWIRNESNNGLSNRRGTVAMVRHPDYPHSATSQFFINTVDNPSLDYRPPKGQEPSDEDYGYTVFGEVIEGMDVVDRIAAVATEARGDFPAVPVEPVIIESIRRIE
jgi:peptidyl-prolyl cis-trans isomerase A (cyclophilin A)